MSKNEKYKKLSGLKFLNKINNKRKRSINGNIKKVIKITAGNKGNFEFVSKIDQINEILEDKKPDIFVVNELNLNYNHDYNITAIKGYNFVIDQFFLKNGIGCTGMWIKENLIYERIKKWKKEESICGNKGEISKSKEI